VKNVGASQQPYKVLAFFADSMHGSLARKLRIFGIDTSYSCSIPDEDLLDECGKQSRVLLTSDKELFKRSLKRGISCVLLLCHSDRENLTKILDQYKFKALVFDPASARCPRCNFELKKLVKRDLHENQANVIPPKSYHLNSYFFECKRCRKIYWEGSHKSALVSLADVVSKELSRTA
jgi:uncharacterized protein with PIN domain